MKKNEKKMRNLI